MQFESENAEWSGMGHQLSAQRRFLSAHRAPLSAPLSACADGLCCLCSDHMAARWSTAPSTPTAIK